MEQYRHFAETGVNCIRNEIRGEIPPLPDVELHISFPFELSLTKDGTNESRSLHFNVSGVKKIPRGRLLSHLTLMQLSSGISLDVIAPLSGSDTGKISQNMIRSFLCDVRLFSKNVPDIADWKEICRYTAECEQVREFFSDACLAFIETDKLVEIIRKDFQFRGFSMTEKKNL